MNEFLFSSLLFERYLIETIYEELTTQLYFKTQNLREKVLNSSEHETGASYE